jgi:ribosomal protein L16 Arg81 hydroxylase
MSDFSPTKQLFPLSSILAPMSEAEFREVYWHKAPCHVQGTPDKFADLFCWEELNGILCSHHWEYPRLRMSLYGVEIPAKDLLQVLPFTKGAAIDQEGIRKQFGLGATLILQHVDEYSESLARVARGLREGLGSHAEIEVIAGNSSSNGLPVHFDANDCLVLQIQGCKRWKLYPPTRLHPLRKSKLYPSRIDVLPALPPTLENPYITVAVNAGDFFYIPRGWWHIVEPEPGPCLSVNPTIYSPTVQDFLKWCVDEWAVAETCRWNLPLDAASESKLLEDVRQLVEKSLDVKSIAQYKSYLAAEMEIERELHLPISLSPQDVDCRSQLRVAGGRAVFVQEYVHEGLVRVRFKGRDIVLDRSFTELLTVFSDSRFHTIEEMMNNCFSSEDRERITKMCQELVRRNIIETSGAAVES